MRWRWRGMTVDLALVLLLALLTAALAAAVFLDVDVAVRDWVDSHRPRPAYWAARALNLLGQGWVLYLAAVLAAGWLARREHSARPLLPVVAAFLALNLLVGPLKLLTDRAAPHNDHNLVALGTDGLSYPSGHVANTIVWYGVLVLLLGTVLPPAARRLLRVVPPAVVMVVTTYLGFHWITDTVAGLLAGLLLDRLLRRVDWNALPLPDRLGGWADPAPTLAAPRA